MGGAGVEPADSFRKEVNQNLKAISLKGNLRIWCNGISIISFLSFLPYLLLTNILLLDPVLSFLAFPEITSKLFDLLPVNYPTKLLLLIFSLAFLQKLVHIKLLKVRNGSSQNFLLDLVCCVFFSCHFFNTSVFHENIILYTFIYFYIHLRIVTKNKNKKITSPIGRGG